MAPDAVSVLVFPIQRLVELAVTDKVGKGLVVMVAYAFDALQPLEEFPVIVYEEVTAGETVKDVPVTFKGCKV